MHGFVVVVGVNHSGMEKRVSRLAAKTPENGADKQVTKTGWAQKTVYEMEGLLIPRARCDNPSTNRLQACAAGGGVVFSCLKILVAEGENYRYFIG